MKRGNKPAYAAKQKRQARRVEDSEREVSHNQDESNQMDYGQVSHANKQPDSSGKKRNQFGSVNSPNSSGQQN